MLRNGTSSGLNMLLYLEDPSLPHISLCSTGPPIYHTLKTYSRKQSKFFLFGRTTTKLTGKSKGNDDIKNYEKRPQIKLIIIVILFFLDRCKLVWVPVINKMFCQNSLPVGNYVGVHEEAKNEFADAYWIVISSPPCQVTQKGSTWGWRVVQHSLALCSIAFRACSASSLCCIPDYCSLKYVIGCKLPVDHLGNVFYRIGVILNNSRVHQT